MTKRKGRFSYALPEEHAQPAEASVTALTEVKSLTEVLAQKPTSLRVPLLLTDEAPLPPRGAPPRSREQGSAAHALKEPEAYALPPQRKGKRSEETLVKRTDVPREQLNVRVRPELKRAAAGLGGLRGMTLGDVVEAALIEYLKAARTDDL